MRCKIRFIIAVCARKDGTIIMQKSQHAGNGRFTYRVVPPNSRKERLRRRAQQRGNPDYVAFIRGGVPYFAKVKSGKTQKPVRLDQASYQFLTPGKVVRIVDENISLVQLADLKAKLSGIF
jgi:hypothetical protein